MLRTTTNAVGQQPSAIERRTAERALIRTFITEVVAVERIRPHMVQVTCGGGDLGEFEPLGPDTFLYVLAPRAGQRTLTFDRTFAWSAYDEMPEADRPVGAYYTMRAWRPERQELDLVVVTHGATGGGSRWAQRVKVGDAVGLWGPRRVYDPPENTDRFLLVGDETGVHAIASILETLPLDARIDVVVEVDGPGDRVPLGAGPNTDVRWIYRGGAQAGTTTALFDEVQQLDLREGTVYAWGGAESRVVTSIRRHLRDTIGLPQDAVAMTGYWRHASTRIEDSE